MGSASPPGRPRTARPNPRRRRRRSAARHQRPGGGSRRAGHRQDRRLDRLQRRRDHSARNRRRAPAPVLAARRAPRGPGEGGPTRRLRAARRRRSAGRDRYRYGYAPVDRRDRPGRRVHRGAALGDRRGRHLRPAAMRVTQTMTVEGSYVSGRLTGSTARLVSSSYAPATIPQRGHGRALLPAVTVRDRVSGARSRHKLVGCGDVSRPSRFAGAGMLSVLTIDLERGLPAVDVDSVLTDGEVVYASASSLYVATERWRRRCRHRRLGGEHGNHRFDISDPGSTDYVASGRVSGYMLGQWSMSEHEGVLRVASTTSPPWRADGCAGAKARATSPSASPTGTACAPVGRVGGIGHDERHLRRPLIGDSGYVVTFRQVDRLYVLDLRTRPRPGGRRAAGPRVLGLSAPVGPAHLLGVGREVSTDGVPVGVQASLFDVTDPASRPARPRAASAAARVRGRSTPTTPSLGRRCRVGAAADRFLHVRAAGERHSWRVAGRPGRRRSARGEVRRGVGRRDPCDHADRRRIYAVGPRGTPRYDQ